MRIETVDPRDDDAFREWFEVLEASGRHERPDEPGWLLQEQRAISLRGVGSDPDVRCELVAVHEQGRPTGVVRIELPLRDNLHLCEIDLAVHPEARRRGVGRVLVEEVERRARELGRTTVVGYSDEPPGSEGCSPGRLAAAALGWEVCQEEVRRDIAVPLEPERVTALQRTCLAYARDYVLRTWVDRCPEDLVAGRAELSRVISTDIPLDRLDWHEESWDAARVRREEALADDMGRTTVNAGAVHTASGVLAGYTSMAVPRERPEHAYQWDTVVRGEHRGHRLGTLVKLAALGEIAARSAETRVITTWNAQENEAMIRVNDALGAFVNGREATLSKVLDPDG